MKASRLLLMFVLVVTGCANYRLGTTLPGNLQSVYVDTFKNSTHEVGVELDITDAVITRFRQDGNLQPVSEKNCDLVLEGEIIGWIRRVMGTSGTDDDEVDEYRLIIQARIYCYNRETGEYLVEGEVVEGKTDFFVEGNLPDSEDAASPDAYRDLARAVVDSVISIW